jgi:dihydrofolate reductase
MTARVRVYMACSFDGFIAGPDGDLAWLTAPREQAGDLAADPAALDFAAFMGEVGCLLMGRSTYDMVQSFGQWPYGETPTLIATRRPLTSDQPTVSAMAGTIDELITAARERAGSGDVYLDGGALVQQALAAGLVDELTITFVPVLLGQGIRLFDGLVDRNTLQFVGHHPMPNGMLQVRARVL